MTSQEILDKYISFYEQRDHKRIPNVSLVPENDPSLLFVNAGMFPLVPYLSGQPHPQGKRLVNIQRSLRLEDIEEAGQTIRHTTVFHMLGNWSLGDYFKREQLNWVYEFYVEVLGMNPQKLYASVFKGDETSAKDMESIEIIKEIFSKYGVDAKENERIFAYGREDNWWQRGDVAGELGGPDSEIFYYVGREGDGLGKNPAENQDEFLEIGNSVFMQYVKTATGWDELSQKNVDFGGGLERIALVVQGKEDIYQTDSFWPIIEKIQEISGKSYEQDVATKKNMRIIADHVRASTLLAMDGVLPSNKEQGYILRRLLRRMVRFGKQLGVERDISVNLVETVSKNLEWLYPKLPAKSREIMQIFEDEENKFRKLLDKSEKQVGIFLQQFDGSKSDLAKQAFSFYQSIGYPPEMFLEDLKNRKIDISDKDFYSLYEEHVKAHQDKSREGAAERFSGGLADKSDETIKYHTATHLLHWAIREVLGNTVSQQGSNITADRLRFDFSHNEKLTENQIADIENLINKKIDEGWEVNSQQMPREEAKKSGALHFFAEKYGDTVQVYYFGESIEESFTKEFCGGPHVKNTNELKPLSIYKQDKIGGDKIRIYARFRGDESS